MTAADLLAAVIVDVARRPDVRAAVAELLAPAPPSAPAEVPSLLSKAQLAAALNVSKSTIDRLYRQGMPLAATVGDQRRFRLADVEAWLASRSKR